MVTHAKATESKSECDGFRGIRLNAKNGRDILEIIEESIQSPEDRKRDTLARRVLGRNDETAHRPLPYPLSP